MTTKEVKVKRAGIQKVVDVAPEISGLVTSFLLELLAYRLLYMIWKKRDLSEV